MHKAIITTILSLLFFAQTAMSIPLVVETVQTQIPLSPELVWLADEEGTLSLEAIRKQDDFAFLRDGFPFQVKGAIWLKLLVKRSNHSALTPAAEQPKLAINLGKIPANTGTLYMRAQKTQLTSDVEVWTSESLQSFEDIVLPSLGATPEYIYMRLEENPGLWFSPTIRPVNSTNPDFIPPDLLLPSLLLLAALVCLLRTFKNRMSWSFWAAVYLGTGLIQIFMPLPLMRQALTYADLPALLAPGLALLMLPQLGRSMLKTYKISAIQDHLLTFSSLLGVLVALAPLLPQYRWVMLLLPLWSLLLLPLIPICLWALTEKLPGAFPFFAACIMPFLGGVIAFFAINSPMPYPLAPMGALWGMAIGGIALALAQIPKETQAEELVIHTPDEEQPTAQDTNNIDTPSAALPASLEADLPLTGLAATTSAMQMPIANVNLKTPLTNIPSLDLDMPSVPKHLELSIDLNSLQPKPQAEPIPSSNARLHLTDTGPLPARPQSNPANTLATQSAPQAPLAQTQGMQAPAQQASPLAQKETASSAQGEAQNSIQVKVPNNTEPEPQRTGQTEVRNADLKEVQDAMQAGVTDSAAPLSTPNTASNNGKATLNATVAASATAETSSQLAYTPSSPKVEATQAASSLEPLISQPSSDATLQSSADPASPAVIIQLKAEKTDAAPSWEEPAPIKNAVAAQNESTVFNLQKLIKDIYDEVAPQAEAKGIAFSWYVQPALPILLTGDEARLRQTLFLLLQNSMLATGSEFIELTVKKQQLGDDFCTVKFTITDTGAERTQEDAQWGKIYEEIPPTEAFSIAFANSTTPYTTLTATFNSPTEAQVLQYLAILAQENAATPLESEITPVEIAPPLHMTELAEQIPPLMLGQKATSDDALDTATFHQQISPAQNSLPRLIVADMTASKLRLTAHYLQDISHECVQAKQASLVIAAFREAPANLILFDADMPEAEVQAAIKDIRGEEALRQLATTPIIGLASHESQIERMRAIGCTDILLKPFSKEDLLAMVSHYLEPEKKNTPYQPAELQEKDDESSYLQSGTHSAKATSPTQDSYAMRFFEPAQSAAQTKQTHKVSATLPSQSAEMVNATQTVTTESATQSKPANVNLQPKPVDVHIETKPTTENIQSKPVATVVQSKPVTISVQSKPVTVNLQPKPATPAAQPKPASTPTQPKAAEATSPNASPSSLSSLHIPAAHSSSPLAALYFNPPQASTNQESQPLTQSKQEAKNSSDAIPQKLSMPTPTSHRKAALASHEKVHHASSPLEIAAPPAPSAPTHQISSSSVVIPSKPEASPENPMVAGVVSGLSIADITPTAPTKTKDDSLLDYIIPDPLAQADTPATTTVATPQATETKMVDEKNTPASATLPSTPDNTRALPAQPAEQPQTKQKSATAQALQAFALPGIEGQSINITMLPLVPGLIGSLQASLANFINGRAAGNCTLVQEAANRLASKSELFGLDKLGKIARCVERAAGANDLEAVNDLGEDLHNVAQKHIDSLNNCYAAHGPKK